MQLVSKRFLEIGQLEEAIEQVGTDSMVSYFFSVDFEMLSRSERAVLRFISEHIGKDDSGYIAGGEFEIAYIAYDWTLNDQGNVALGKK